MHSAVRMDTPSLTAWHERPDIVARVLSCLPTTQDVCNCEAVCRTWRNVRVASLPSVVHLSGSIQASKLKWAALNIDRIHNIKMYLIEHTNPGQRHELLGLVSKAATLEQLDISDTVFDSCLDMLMDRFRHLVALKHLTIQNCPCIVYLPASIGCLERLQFLKVHNCRNLKVLWGPSSNRKYTQQMSSLQHLSISRCRSLERLLDLTPFSSVLQHLTLTGCGTLIELPQGTSQLTRLQELKIGDMPALKSLPDLQRLVCMQSLTVYGCESLKQLPCTLGELTALTQLTLNSCPALQGLPSTLQFLTQLKHLTLFGCDSMVPLPDSLGKLQGLQQLTISDFHKLLALPCSLWCLSNLQQLTIARCSLLTTLPNLPDAMQGSSSIMGNLKHFSIIECQSLQELPSFLGHLSAVVKLHVSNCSSLTALPASLTHSSGLSQSLQQLALLDCGIQHLPHDTGSLKSLQLLSLHCLSKLSTLPSSLVCLTALEQLGIFGCDSLQALPVHGWEQMVALQHVEIVDCKLLMSLPRGLSKLPKLRVLDVSACDSLQIIPESVTRLSCLQLS